MSTYWQTFIEKNEEVVKKGGGSSFVLVVTGTEGDSEFWRDRFRQHASLLFHAGEAPAIGSAVESVPVGNFLGTLKAWSDAGDSVRQDGGKGGTGLMMMVVGSGTRLSPFTQKLRNRKSAFPTPRSAGNGEFLSVGELAAGSVNGIVDFLESRGFRGLLVKWGDEFVLPGAPLDLGTDDLSGVDFIRFGQQTEPTPELAVHKEWIVSREGDFEEVGFVSRQGFESLKTRLAGFGEGCHTSVNLGSLGVSFEALELLVSTFGDVLAGGGGKINWDPYFWLALHCRSVDDWNREKQVEEENGLTGMRELEEDFPDFFQRMTEFREKLEEKRGGAIRVKAFEFGDVYWADFGLQSRLREHVYWLLEDSERGDATRALYGITAEPDARGNRIAGSEIAEGAVVENSLIIDAKIESPDSVIRNSVIVGGTYGIIRAPVGGIAIESTAKELVFDGENGIAFRSRGDSISIPAGGRHTTVERNGGDADFTANEDTFDDASFFDAVIGENPISFRELAAERKEVPPGG